MRKALYFLCVLALLFYLELPLLAYETVEVNNGGTIEGVLEFAGARVPKDQMIAITADKSYCGASISEKKYAIRDRKVANAVVYLIGIKAGKAIPDRPVTVTNDKCEFVPRIALAFKGNQLIMRNDDPILHTFDVHASVSGMEIYHVSLSGKDSSVAKTLQQSGVMELSCYIHPWQHAYVYIFDHPYAALTGEDGSFSITGIPPGTYTVEAWHEALGMKKIMDVKVESGKTSAIKLEYTKDVSLY